jgi:hypothetical protein
LSYRRLGCGLDTPRRGGRKSRREPSVLASAREVQACKKKFFERFSRS